MSMLSLFNLGGRWLALDGSRLVETPEYPRLDLPTMVISDFNNALTGVISLEANPSMAAPLIERRLRDEGMVEGETRLEISHLIRVGKGFQALYSAVPMSDWQQMVSWAGSSQDHCLVVPLLSVAKRLQEPGQGVVIRHGKQVTFLAITADAIQHAETLAYSDNVEGVRDAVKALADRVRALLGRGRRPDKVIWYALDAAPGQDDNALAAVFGESLGLDVQMAAHRSLLLDSGDTIQSAMSEVAAAVQVSDSAGSGVSGLMLMAERALPLAAVAAGVLALALLFLGWHAHSSATDNANETSELRAQATDLINRTQSQLATLSVDSAGLQNTHQFLQRLADASRGQDMSVAMAKVRQAAQTWVHILRLRIGETDHRLYVEGAIDEGQRGAERLGLFIANLRAAGYDPVAVDPPLGTRSANYFAYALLPAVTAGTEKAQ